MALSPEELRDYQREWTAARKREWFVGRECVRCGSSEGVRLKRRRGVQVPKVNWGWRRERLDAVIAKGYDVLCPEHYGSVERARRPRVRPPVVQRPKGAIRRLAGISPGLALSIQDGVRRRAPMQLIKDG